MLCTLLIGQMGTMGKSVGATGVGRIADPAASVTYETARRESAMAAPTATASQLVSLGGAQHSRITRDAHPLRTPQGPPSETIPIGPQMLAAHLAGIADVTDAANPPTPRALKNSLTAADGQAAAAVFSMRLGVRLVLTLKT